MESTINVPYPSNPGCVNLNANSNILSASRCFGTGKTGIISLGNIILIFLGLLLNQCTAMTITTIPTTTSWQLIERAQTTGTPTTDGIATATLTEASSLPQPFDTSLGSNFTAPSCPQFFKTFLNDKDFISCYPFSLLLQTSVGFFADERSIFQTTQVLDASCSVNFQKCSNVMSKYATQLRLADNCGLDYNSQNPLVIQALVGLNAYDVMYKAGCMKDSTGAYCFASAITNVTPIADSYLYYLPMGLTLPPGEAQSCDSCVQQTMQLFANSAAGQLLTKTYTAAAQQINNQCGANWVPSKAKTSLASATTSSSVLHAILLSIFISWVLR